MGTLFIILACLIVNTFVGLIAFALMDDDKERVGKWFDDAFVRFGVFVGFIVQLIILSFWFIFVAVVLREKKSDRNLKAY